MANDQGAKRRRLYGKQPAENIWIREFECPVCLDQNDSVGFECRNGHKVCRGCADHMSNLFRDDLRKCPTCRDLDCLSFRERSLITHIGAMLEAANVDTDGDFDHTAHEKKFDPPGGHFVIEQVVDLLITGRALEARFLDDPTSLSIQENYTLVHRRSAFHISWEDLAFYYRDFFGDYILDPSGDELGMLLYILGDWMEELGDDSSDDSSDV